MLNAALADDRVEAMIVPIGKGELVCRKSPSRIRLTQLSGIAEGGLAGVGATSWR